MIMSTSKIKTKHKLCPTEMTSHALFQSPESHLEQHNCPEIYLHKACTHTRLEVVWSFSLGVLWLITTQATQPCLKSSVQHMRNVLAAGKPSLPRWSFVHGQTSQEARTLETCRFISLEWRSGDAKLHAGFQSGLVSIGEAC